MAGLGGLISNLISRGTALLPAIQDSLFTPCFCISLSSSDNQIREIEKDLKRLMRMLKRIQATLRDAQRREIRDELVQLWLTELREVAYDADDVLDEWRYEQIKTQVEARNASNGNPNKKKLIQIPDGLADQIKEIRCRFDEICKDHEALQLREEDGARIPEPLSLPIPTSHLYNETNIFGRENEKNELINLLLYGCNEKKIMVLPIVGMGGLGKTTLAQLVYNDKDIRQKFDRLGWVWVHNNFDVKRITKAILESVSIYGSNFTELSSMQEELERVLAGKSMFLVLDDVWNDQPSHWQSLMTPFISAKEVSILVTTRNQSVALAAQTVPFVKLNALPDEQCWQIFQHYALGDFPKTEHSDLLELGREIMNKCSGLPLAVKSIATLLRCENEERWEEILQSEIWEAYPEIDAFAALRISYERLPEHLKSCLLFCSMFPKSHLYKEDELINLWIAQDYVVSRGKMSLTETGVEYVKELRQRSFLELNIINSYRSPHNMYKIHDIIHDLLHLISRGEHRDIHVCSPVNNTNEICHHLFVDGNSDLIVRHFLPQKLTTLRTLILWCQEVPFNDNWASNVQRLRALEIFYRRENNPLHPLGQMKHLRHLVLHKCDRDLESIEQLLNLRFLLLTHSKLKELPNSFGNLASLKSLSLSNCGIESLPESFCLLSNLEKLNMEHCNLKILPKNFGKLVSLRELRINWCPLEAFPDSLCELGNLKCLTSTVDYSRPIQLPEAIGNLSSLQVLGIKAQINHLPSSFNEIYRSCRSTRLLKVVAGNFGLGWLKDFENVKGVLCFEWLSNLNKLQVGKNILAAMHDLEELVIGWGMIEGSLRFGPILERENILYVSAEPQNAHPKWQYKLERMPGEGMSFTILRRLRPHPNLKQLSLSQYPGNMLPGWMGDPFVCASLQTITMDSCDNISSLPFGNLRFLKNFFLSNCRELSSLDKDSLPSQLEKLDIDRCDNLIAIPVILKLVSLVVLKISYCINLRPSLKLVDWLPLPSCSVQVYGCPPLKDWCVERGIQYKEHPWCEP